MNHYVTHLVHAVMHVPGRRVHVSVRVGPAIVITTTCRKAYVKYTGYIYMYTSIYGSLSCEGLVTLFVMCDLGDPYTLQHLKELPIRRFLLQCERSAVLLKILSRILPQKDREEARKAVSSSGMI